MQQCSETITVYNSYTDPTTKYKTYLPTVIKGISWFGEIKTTVSPDGLISNNQYTIRIPTNSDSGIKLYVDPKKYESLSTELKKNYYTFAEGDIILLGEHVETGEDAKPANLAKKYVDVATILAVTDNRRSPNGKHFKVVGK